MIDEINRLAEEIAVLSVPRDDEPFTEWSSAFSRT
jgi:hypothetical protein